MLIILLGRIITRQIRLLFIFESTHLLKSLRNFVKKDPNYNKNDHECSTVNEISILLPLFNLLSKLSKHLQRGQKECKSQSMGKIVMECCPLDVAHMN